MDSLPPITVDDSPVLLDIHLDGISTRPVVDGQTGEPVRWNALYVGMRIPGCYLTDDAAFDAAIAYISDPDAWQRNFRGRMHSHHGAIPGLA